MQAHTDNVNFEWTPERHTIYQEIVDRHGGPYNMTAGMVLDEMGPAIVKAHGFGCVVVAVQSKKALNLTVVVFV